MNKHPELRDGEVFLTNISLDRLDIIGYKSKRTGKVAYDINGNSIDPINRLYPVFVAEDEFKEITGKK